MLPKSSTAPACAVLTVVVLALMLLPQTAAASSIAFIKAGNVWLTSPDGSRQRQVTTDGGATKSYNWPSQADDGTILAKFGGSFVRMRPDGTRIGNPVPGLGSDVGHSGGLTVMSGPNDPRISPDGKRFSYWLSVRNLVTCPIWDPGCSYDDTDYTVVSHVDRFTDPQEFGAVRDYRDPSWIGNDRLLVFNYGLGVMEGAISHVGAGEPGLLQWFDPPSDLPQIGQGQLTRQGDKLVTLAGTAAFGPAQEHLYFYGVSGPHPTPPEPKCYVAEGAPPSGKFLLPSWSPDGTELAVTESDGIHIFGNIPDLRAAAPNCEAITERLLVYGSAPAWGPADVPAAAAPAPPPAAGPGGSPANPAAPIADVVVARRQQGRAVRLRVNVPAAGSTVRARLLAGRRKAVVGSTVKRNVQAGALTLDVRLNRRGRAALRRKAGLRLSVRVAVTAPGGAPVSAVRPVVLRR